MRIVWDYFGHMRAWDGMRRYVRLDLGKTEQPQPGEDDVVTLAEAQYLVARAQGFESWHGAGRRSPPRCRRASRRWRRSRSTLFPADDAAESDADRCARATGTKSSR